MFSFRDLTLNSRLQERIAYNEQVSRLRPIEYGMLKGATYLDHAGTTLAAKSLAEAYSKEAQTRLLTNPHSSASAPSSSGRMISDTRNKVLGLFKASEEHFTVVFVANATAGIKLVLEAFTAQPDGFSYLYHRDAHTSIVGVRELAKSSHCFEDDVEVERWLRPDSTVTESDSEKDGISLFAYPAQSNMNGRRLPLSWPADLRRSGSKDSYSLLDASAYVTTSALDLSDPDRAPDFTVCSFYKIFGFPNLGCVIVRNRAGHLFENRRYFGGGTTDMITVKDNFTWVAKKDMASGLEARLEDGTLPIHSILALNCAIDVHQQLYGGFHNISKHTGFLAQELYTELSSLQYKNGAQVCRMYTDPGSSHSNPTTQGATVTFNILDTDGQYISAFDVFGRALKHDIYIRTGSLCNPGGAAHLLDLTNADLKKAYDEGMRCGKGGDVRDGKAFGVVRCSFGACSTLRDVKMFVTFVRQEFMQKSNHRELGPGLDSRVLPVDEKEEYGSKEVVTVKRKKSFWARARECLR